MPTDTEIKLTQLTTAGGCGCKLSPTLLRQLLADSPAAAAVLPPDLITGWESSDDAACWKISDDTAILATADFFSPIVDSPDDFGKIAAANALSDIYAMGGTPLFALALCAMPKNTLPPPVIRRILEGGKSICAQAGIAVAGGHSIDSAEPLYGLCVIGTAHPDRIIRNHTARPGDTLLLTKPLGIGIYSAALRRGKLTAAQYAEMLATITQLNRAGSQLAGIATAMTDVTGFGLLGHLAEMCAGGVGAEIHFGKIPLLTAAAEFAQAGIVTGASARNHDSIKSHLTPTTDTASGTANTTARNTATASTPADNTAGSTSADNTAADRNTPNTPTGNTTADTDNTDNTENGDTPNTPAGDSAPANKTTAADLALWQQNLLTDPQTGGGLLITAPPQAIPRLQAITPATPIGTITATPKKITLHP